MHIHLSLLDERRAAAAVRRLAPGLPQRARRQLRRRACSRHARGAERADARRARCPASGLRPHHWSAGAVCLGERNREALLRIPPLVDARRRRAPAAPAAPGVPRRRRGREPVPRARRDRARRARRRARAGCRPPPILDRDPATLDEAGGASASASARCRRSLEEALGALARGRGAARALDGAAAVRRLRRRQARRDRRGGRAAELERALPRAMRRSTDASCSSELLAASSAQLAAGGRAAPPAARRPRARPRGAADGGDGRGRAAGAGRDRRRHRPARSHRRR